MTTSGSLSPPAQQYRKTAVDAVHVVGGDLHRGADLRMLRLAGGNSGDKPFLSATVGWAEPLRLKAASSNALAVAAEAAVLSKMHQAVDPAAASALA